MSLVLYHTLARSHDQRQHDGSSSSGLPQHPPLKEALTKQIRPEVWARSVPGSSSIRDGLDNDTISQLTELCGRCLYRTLTHYTRIKFMGQMSIVLTGDIPAIWIRDSAVQIATYLPRIKRHAAMRRVVEGAIRAQAFLILQDPWANAYNPEYKSPEKLPKKERQLGRGGWVWNRNFELDSIAYFYNLLWNWYGTEGLWAPETLLLEPLVHDAVVEYLRVLQVEQDHAAASPYRYSELPNDGMGSAIKATGMIWSAFRPSDDPQKFGFSVPDNIYVAGALSRLLILNEDVWHDPYISKTAGKLYEDISDGIRKHGVVPSPDDGARRIYAYEVDGLGNALTDFDDPNVPSLLAIPLLGWEGVDVAVYEATRSRILSAKNPFYFSGSKFDGLGSPHTYHQYVWPLATVIEALTTNNVTRQLQLLRYLLPMASVNGLMHESVHVDAPERFSRAEFGWANALTVVAVEQLLGIDCDEAAAKHRLNSIKEREDKEPGAMPNKGPDDPLYYELLESSIAHVRR